MKGFEVSLVGLDGETLVGALIDVPDTCSAMGRVPSLYVGYGDPMHKGRHGIVVRRPEQQVPVVGHDAIAANPHAEPVDALGEDLFEGEEITFLLEYPQSPVGTVKGMVDNSTFGYAFSAHHENMLIHHLCGVNKNIHLDALNYPNPRKRPEGSFRYGLRRKGQKQNSSDYQPDIKPYLPLKKEDLTVFTAVLIYCENRKRAARLFTCGPVSFDCCKLCPASS